jgi:CelD/BcsL family acetyltransferase involved in cellulose biosynthesis
MDFPTIKLSRRRRLYRTNSYHHCEKTNMKTDIIKDVNLLSELEPLWEKLLEQGPADPIFGSFIWAREWWLNFRGSRDDLRVIVLKEGCDIFGLAGLYLTLERWGPIKAKVLAPLGRTTAEYLDLIFPSGGKDGCYVLLQRLLQDKDWDVFSLNRLPASSPTRRSIKNAASELGLLVVEEEEQLCPFIGLNGSFDAYMRKHFSRNFRKNIRRKTKKLNNLGKQRFEMVTDGLNLDDKLAMVFDLEDRSWKGQRGVGIFGTEEKRTFFTKVAKSMASHKRLALHLQYLDDRLLAYNFGFVTNKKLYDYSLAFDPDFASYSPGLLSLVDLLSRCFEKGIRIFDFLRGAEKYKKLWTDTATQNINLHVFSPNIRARTLAMGLKNRLALRRIKRRFRQPPNEAQFEIRHD